MFTMVVVIVGTTLSTVSIEAPAGTNSATILSNSAGLSPFTPPLNTMVSTATSPPSSMSLSSTLLLHHMNAHVLVGTLYVPAAYIFVPSPSVQFVLH
jgi:hypothetical protein